MRQAAAAGAWKRGWVEAGEQEREALLAREKQLSVRSQGGAGAGAGGAGGGEGTLEKGAKAGDGDQEGEGNAGSQGKFTYKVVL